VTQKIVFAFFYFALKAELQVLKFEFSSLKLEQLQVLKFAQVNLIRQV